MEFETLAKIFIPGLALIVAILVLVIKYYRPIYYSFSKKYNKTTISDAGELVEITTRNFGINSETNIKIEISNNLKINLITDTEGVTIDNNILNIARISGASSINMLILVEGGTFNKDSIICAKTDMKDIDYRNEQETKYSYLQAVFATIFVVVAILFIGVMGYLVGESHGRHEEVMRHLQEQRKQTEVEKGENEDPATIRRRTKLEALGWLSLDKRFSSKQFIQAYGDDVPIKLLRMYTKNGLRCFDFEATNKLNDFFEVQASVMSSFEGDATQAKVRPEGFWRGPVVPSRKTVFSIQHYVPTKNDEYCKYVFKFFISTVTEIYPMVLSIEDTK